MKRLNNIFLDVHLYTGKLEYLIKLLIWVLCWIGGVYATRNITKGIEASYFVFSLALLMEFAPQIKKKKDIVARVAHSLFCFAMVAILVFAALILFTAEYNKIFHNIMYSISFGIMGYMILDCLILWISIGASNDDMPQGMNGTKDDEVSEFNKRLKIGNLGNIM